MESEAQTNTTLHNQFFYLESFVIYVQNSLFFFCIFLFHSYNATVWFCICVYYKMFRFAQQQQSKKRMKIFFHIYTQRYRYTRS